jgi:hypothetical protein
VKLPFDKPVNRPTISMAKTTLRLRRQMYRPVERRQLAYCLKLLDLWPIPGWSPGFYGSRQSFRRGANSPNLKHISREKLYDLYDLARKQWLLLYKKFKVQTGQNHEIGVWLNLLWVRVKVLFRRIGIEPIFG